MTVAELIDYLLDTQVNTQVNCPVNVTQVNCPVNVVDNTTGQSFEILEVVQQYMTGPNTVSLRIMGPIG